jgi:hypothetical protein
MTKQTQEQERIPSKTLKDRILALAGEMDEKEPFGAHMFDLLRKVSRLRFICIQNYLGYSIAERRDVSYLLEQVDKLYDDRLQLARNREYYRLIQPVKGR